jgi:uncharacterized membrane protein
MDLDLLTLARTLHVLAIVLWIGGVAFVTLIILPAALAIEDPAQRTAFFRRAEHKFAAQARLTTLVAGASGLYMLWALDAWDRFSSLTFWWGYAMVLVWLIFTVMLFVLEPLVLKKTMPAQMARDPDGTLRKILRVHQVLLALSLITIAGAIYGAH